MDSSVIENNYALYSGGFFSLYDDTNKNEIASYTATFKRYVNPTIYLNNLNVINNKGNMIYDTSDQGDAILTWPGGFFFLDAKSLIL
jgi:hypothetical protein